jgi:lipid-A-disaccharide synthase-like uncharacterized protein
VSSSSYIDFANNNQFFIFEAAMNVVVASIAIVLIVSEVGLFSGYFARNWPSLSLEHGFVSLASAMLVLGVHVLSCLNQSSNSKEHLGMAFWRVVIMAGILNLILGVFNLVAVSLFINALTSSCARFCHPRALAISRHHTGSWKLSKCTVAFTYGTHPLSRAVFSSLWICLLFRKNCTLRRLQIYLWFGLRVSRE